MRLSEHQRIFSHHIAKLIIFAYDNGIELTFGEGYRTIDQQSLYYHGKSIKEDDGTLQLIDSKKRTKTMRSKHLERLAVDFNFFINGKLTYKLEDVRILGEYWESLDERNESGMFWNFYDAPHFQRNK